MRFFITVLVLMSFHLHASDDFLMRQSWVRTLKELVSDIEFKDKKLLVENERKFIELFESAWADSRYNCIYGGWPSVKSGKYCQNPKKTNSSYDKGACKENELQCQPLLFGKGLCVSFKTPADREKISANCESKFQEEKNGKYDFLENPTRKESEDLQELSRLAHEVCTDKSTPVCKKILDKFPSGMKAIDQGFTRAVASDVMSDLSKLNKLTTKKTTEPVSHDPECREETHEHENLAEAMTKVAGNDLFDKIKAEFESSSFCDPTKVVNDPSERPSGLIMNKLMKDLSKIDPFGRQETNQDYLYRITHKYKLPESLVTEVLPLLNAIKGTTEEYENRRTLIAKARIKITQNFLANYKADPSTNNLILEALVENNIFSQDEEGKNVCPFVSKDAFEKAMAGRQKVMAKFGSSIPNKNQITIVDYSMPSNHRRMFVIDLATGKVIHNTWTAHGGGGGQADGVDGLGSSPEMSNVSGSNKSSDGFIIATQKASGKLFGNNVLLRGIDENNTNLAARAVVLHGWGSPMYQYSTGVEDYNYETDNYDPPYDVIQRVKNANVETADRKELEKAYSGISASASTSPFMNATEGCLGVPVINVKHLDRKGRNKSQLELLRDDLPGSLIFNYSGPEMQSKFF